MSHINIFNLNIIKKRILVNLLLLQKLKVENIFKNVIIHNTQICFKTHFRITFTQLSLDY